MTQPDPTRSHEDPRQSTAAEQRRRAEEFARREVSDENLPRLLQELLTPSAPPEGSVQRMRRWISRRLRR